MFRNSLCKIILSVFVLSVVLSFFAVYKGNLFAEEELEVIKRPLLGNDLPAYRVKRSEDKDHAHDHKKHKKKPVLLPGPQGKVLIGENWKGDPVKGKEIYKKYCFYCHGRTGHGDGMTVVALSTSPADFTRPEGVFGESTDQQNFDYITYGVISSYHLNMPAFGPILTVQERLDVLAYLKELLKGQLSKKKEESSHEGHAEKEDASGEHSHD